MAKAKKKPPVDSFGDPLPVGARARLGTLRFRLERTDYLHHIAITGDSSLIAVSVDRGVVRVWDAQTGVIRHTLKVTGEKRDYADRVMFSRDATRLAVVRGQYVEVFDVASGERIAGVSDSSPSEALFTADGTGLILPPFGENVLRIRDIASGALRVESTTKGWHYNAVALSHDGKRIAFAKEGRPAIYDAATLELQRELPTENVLPIAALGFTADDTSLIALRSEPQSDNGPRTQTAQRWNVETGESTALAWPIEDGGATQRLSSDARFAFVLAGRNPWRREVVDLESGTSRLSIPGHAYDAAFSRDRLVMLERGTVRVFELPSLREIVIERGGHTDGVRDVRFAGDTVITYGEDSTRTWNVTTGEELASGPPSKPAPRPVPAHGVTAKHGDRDVIRGFRGDTQLFEYQAGHSVYGLDVSPTKPHVAFGNWIGWLRVVDAETGNVIWSFQIPAKTMLVPMTRVAYTPDGRRIAGGGHGKFLALFDAQTGARTQLVGHTASIDAIMFSPSGKLLFSKDARSTRMWNVETGEALGVLKDLWPNAWSADSKVAATIEFTSVVLWDTEAALPPAALALL